MAKIWADRARLSGASLLWSVLLSYSILSFPVLSPLKGGVGKKRKDQEGDERPEKARKYQERAEKPRKEQNRKAKERQDWKCQNPPFLIPIAPPVSYPVIASSVFPRLPRLTSEDMAGRRRKNDI